MIQVKMLHVVVNTVSVHIMISCEREQTGALWFYSSTYRLRQHSIIGLAGQVGNNVFDGI